PQAPAAVSGVRGSRPEGRVAAGLRRNDAGHGWRTRETGCAACWPPSAVLAPFAFFAQKRGSTVRHAHRRRVRLGQARRTRFGWTPRGKGKVFPPHLLPRLPPRPHTFSTRQTAIAI